MHIIRIPKFIRIKNDLFDFSLGSVEATITNSITTPPTNIKKKIIGIHDLAVQYQDSIKMFRLVKIKIVIIFIGVLKIGAIATNKMVLALKTLIIFLSLLKASVLGIEE